MLRKVSAAGRWQKSYSKWEMVGYEKMSKLVNISPGLLLVCVHACVDVCV